MNLAESSPVDRAAHMDRNGPRPQEGDTRMRTGTLKCVAILAAVVVLPVGLGGPAWAAKGKTLREAYVGSASVFNPSRCEGCGITYPSGLCRPPGSGGAGEPFNPTGKNVGRVCFTGLTSPGKYKV